ncbi:zinc-dependent alcohol dehydrogenase [Jatrophihabitans endophyticus]|uniref:zinc-dependent alcohol dehydrogenase n=1 Tax=Jatrophihabitans endophyticus TaxID=1206085 RepID=UPI00093554BD|nr:alcohol dehydrogenase catalytic domain-containing protein [Jatrophihabitans endophyticus]
MTLEDAAEPVPDPGRTQRVRIVSAGICGSDLGFIAQGGVPVVPGHEMAGLTDDGRPVAVQPNAACSDCPLCASGRANLCPSSMANFSGMAGVDGGFADYVLARPEQLHELPASLPVELGALVEPAAVARHALVRLAAPAGAEVLVVGAGTIGLLAAAMLTPTHSVSLATRHPHQRAAAEALGVRAVDPDDAFAADAVLDSAGGQSSLELAIDAARPGAGIVTLGAATWQPKLTETILYKELDLRLSLIYTGDDFRDALTFLAGRPDIAPTLVTHHFALADAEHAFAAAGARSGQRSIKVLMHP